MQHMHFSMLHVFEYTLCSELHPGHALTGHDMHACMRRGQTAFAIIHTSAPTHIYAAEALAISPASANALGICAVDVAAVDGLNITSTKNVSNWRPAIGWCSCDTWSVLL